MNRKTTSKHCPKPYKHMDNMLEKGYCEACGHKSELLKKFDKSL